MTSSGELYVLTFANGMQYVGLTTEGSARRFQRHKQSVRRGDTTTIMHNAWRKYGAPHLRVLAVVQRPDLAASEVRAIQAFGTVWPGGYNMMDGGQTSPSKSPMVKAKISEKLKGRVIPRHVVEAMRKANIGRKQTAEHIAKCVAARTGSKRTPEQRANISKAKKGKCTVSAEHLARMTAAAAAKPQTAEQIAKRVASIMKNRDAWRAKLSESNRKAWAAKKAARVDQLSFEGA